MSCSLAERDGHVECARFLKSCVEDVKSGTGVLSQLLNSGGLNSWWCWGIVLVS